MGKQGWFLKTTPIFYGSDLAFWLSHVGFCESNITFWATDVDFWEDTDENLQNSCKAQKRVLYLRRIIYFGGNYEKV